MEGTHGTGAVSKSELPVERLGAPPLNRLSYCVG